MIRLQVSILYTVGAIAMPEQASHEVGTPDPGTNRFLKRRGFKTQHVTLGFLHSRVERGHSFVASILFPVSLCFLYHSISGITLFLS